MTVYVGPCMWEFRGWRMGHMFCDPGRTEELHSLAREIGLKRAWFQDHARHPHYDITDRYRRAAIRGGAVDLPDMHKEAAVHELHHQWRDALTAGRVYDIRTGRSIGRTRSLTETFVNQVKALIESDDEFYIVYGRCQHGDVRKMVTFLRTLDDLPVIFDARMAPDTVFIFEGDPAELGFAS